MPAERFLFHLQKGYKMTKVHPKFLDMEKDAALYINLATEALRDRMKTHSDQSKCEEAIVFLRLLYAETLRLAEIVYAEPEPEVEQVPRLRT